MAKSRFYKERQVDRKKRKAIRWWFVSIRHGRHVLSQCPNRDIHPPGNIKKCLLIPGVMLLFRALTKNMAPMTNADESPTNRLTLFWLNISLFIVSTLCLWSVARRRQTSCNFHSFGCVLQHNPLFPHNYCGKKRKSNFKLCFVQEMLHAWLTRANFKLTLSRINATNIGLKFAVQTAHTSSLKKIYIFMFRTRSFVRLCDYLAWHVPNLFNDSSYVMFQIQRPLTTHQDVRMVVILDLDSANFL